MTNAIHSNKSNQKSAKHKLFRKQFADDLNVALDQQDTIPAGYGRVMRVAELFGVSQNTAGNWLKGDGVPELARLPEIAEILGTTIEQLIFGDQAPRSHARDECYAKVGLHLTGGAVGAAWYALPETLESLGLPRESAMLQVGDDDMAPWIERGDVVIYDPLVHAIHASGVFVLRVGERCVVRRVQRGLTQQIRLICDNAAFADEMVDAADFAASKEDSSAEAPGARIVVVGEVLGRLTFARRQTTHRRS
ncbi:MAG: LexA family transcriptional regulator [Propionivibrio sp.]